MSSSSSSSSSSSFSSSSSCDSSSYSAGVSLAPVLAVFESAAGDDSKLIGSFARAEVNCKKYTFRGRIPVYSLKYSDAARYNTPQVAVTRLCRGLFVLSDGTPICRPFDKFFNYGELVKIFPEEVKELRLDELSNWIGFKKLDGQILKLFYFQNEWQWGTNSVPFEKPKAVNQFFQEKKLEEKELYDPLDKEYTYIFELTEPFAHVTLYSSTQIHLIGVIHTATGKDIDITTDTKGISSSTIPITPFQSFSSLTDCINLVSTVEDASDPGFEGFVVVSRPKDSNCAAVRLKIKNTRWFSRDIPAKNEMVKAAILKKFGFNDSEINLKNFSDWEECCSYMKEYKNIEENIAQQIKADAKELEKIYEELQEMPAKTGQEKFQTLAQKVGQSDWKFKYLIQTVKNETKLNEQDFLNEILKTIKAKGNFPQRYANKI